MAHLRIVGLLLAEDRLALVEQRALLLGGLQLLLESLHLRRHLLRASDVLVLPEAGDHLVELLEALAEGLLLGLHRHRGGRGWGSGVGMRDKGEGSSSVTCIATAYSSRSAVFPSATSLHCSSIRFGLVGVEVEQEVRWRWKWRRWRWWAVVVAGQQWHAPRQGAPERLGHLVRHQILPPLEHRAVVDQFLQPLLQLGQRDVEAGHVPAGGEVVGR